MTDLTVVPLNSTYDHIVCDDSIAQELYEMFSFEHPDAAIIKRKVARLKYWDGFIHIFTKKRRQLYQGLRAELQRFADDNGYTISFQQPKATVEFSEHEAREFIKTLKLPSHIDPYDHQIAAFLRAVREERALILSATASGKSLTIYLMAKYWNTRVLIIVPTINLVKQMKKHFEEYGLDPNEVHQIYADGDGRDTNKQFTVSTFHSIYEQPSSWFNQFDAIIMDECLHPDTLITTDKGKIPIKDIQIGDLVLTINENTNKFEYKPVKKVYRNDIQKSLNEDFYEIQCSDDKILKISGNHKVLTSCGWVEARNLSEGDEIINTSCGTGYEHDETNSMEQG